MKKQNFTQEIMAEQITLRKQANDLAARLRWWDIFLNSRRFRRLVEIEEKILHNESRIEYILKLAFNHIPGLARDFAETVGPYQVLSEEEEVKRVNAAHR
jgi:hypothetical protein